MLRTLMFILSAAVILLGGCSDTNTSNENNKETESNSDATEQTDDTAESPKKTKPINKAEAVELVKNKKGLTGGNIQVEFDHKEKGNYVIHVFEEVSDESGSHTATKNWYYVDPNTKEITKMFPNGKEKKQNLTTFAPPENVMKYFAGKGNEFATYNTETYNMQGNLMATVQHSGGNTLTVYRFEEDKISIVYEQGGYHQEKLPELGSLTGKQQERVLLAAPIKKGATFGEWAITSTETTLQTPYGEIGSIISVKKESANGGTAVYYWAKNLGIVKTEQKVKTEDGNEYTVMSHLEKIEEK